MTESPAPPPTRIPVRIAWYAAAGLLALVLAGIGYRLDQHDLRVPLLYHDPRGLETDSILILPMVKSTLEHGHHWRCDRLGAPDGQTLYDFPVVDHLHFLGIGLLGLFTHDVGLVFNLYFLLTFPLTVWTAMAVLRHFGVSLPGAATAGVLYAFAPYHLVRWENHYFLSAYFVVPVTLMVILWVCDGPLPFFPQGPDGRRRFRVSNRTTLLALVIAAATSAAGAYYAFFACVLLGAAGLYGWAARGTWRGFASGLLLAGVVTVCGVLNHLPAVIHQSEYGRNVAPTLRFSEETEYYGLKLTQLLFPIDDHSLQILAYNKTSYNSVDRPAQAWTERYALGTVAALGCVGLLARLVLPGARRKPFGPLAAVTAAALLFAGTGGFGAMFNHVISPQVRCHNRIAIYIAFLALYAVAVDLDALAGWVRGRLHNRFWRFGLTYPVYAAVTWFGVWDQTPFYWGGQKQVARNESQQKFFAADREFYSKVEEMLNPGRETPGPMVFQLPYVAWPEAPTVGRLFSYEHARGYLHTDTLRWGFGTMKGRALDEWYRKVSAQPPEQLLERVVKAGFEGLLLDRRGYAPARADAVEQQFARTLGAAAKVVHKDGQQIVFDLRPYRDWLKQNVGRSWDEECRKERQPVTAEWLAGFASFKEPGYEWLHRWCKADGVAVFVNPTDGPKTVKCRFHVRTTAAEPTTLTVRGAPVWDEVLEINNATAVQTREFVIPPGRTTIAFHCDPPSTFIPSDSRKLFWFLAGLKIE